jgi:hypothetical protein
MKPWNAMQTRSIADPGVATRAVAVSLVVTPGENDSVGGAGSEAGAVTDGFLKAKGSSPLK